MKRGRKNPDSNLKAADGQYGAPGVWGMPLTATGYCVPINFLQQGYQSFNRLGSVVENETLLIRWFATPCAKGAETLSGQLSVFYDTQPTPLLPSYDEVYGGSTIAGYPIPNTASRPFPRFDNRERFHQLSSHVIEISPNVQSTATHWEKIDSVNPQTIRATGTMFIDSGGQGTKANTATPTNPGLFEAVASTIGPNGTIVYPTATPSTTLGLLTRYWGNQALLQENVPGVYTNPEFETETHLVSQPTDAQDNPVHQVEHLVNRETYLDGQRGGGMIELDLSGYSTFYDDIGFPDGLLYVALTGTPDLSGCSIGFETRLLFRDGR